MLRSLDIRNIAIIERLSMDFRAGLNVLTGETGAGKSILLDALGFALGWRGRADMVRAGAERGEVTAVFEISAAHPARTALAEAGIDADGDELILRRTNSLDGRKTAWINDRRVSGETLRALSETLVELHGQQDDRGLLNTRGHRVHLDAFAGAADRLRSCRSAWRDWRAAGDALTAAERAHEQAVQEEDFLRHGTQELARLAPGAGEDQTLDARRRLMQAASKISDDIARAAATLAQDGAEGAISDATRWLGGVAERAEGRLEGAIAALGRAQTELGEAQADIEACLADLSFDPAELEQVEERLFAIRAMARKHQVHPDELATVATALESKIADLDRGAGELDALRTAVADAERQYFDIAAKLGELRRQAATRLDAAMSREFAPLKMDNVVFATAISPGEPGPEGTDAVQFTISTDPGAPPGPLGKIASGGELSRFLLALKVCLTAGNDGLTMIFDEIDRGVGGATADAVGRRLARLAEGSQVLVVTHSPQVAARGAHHWRVHKRTSHGQTRADAEDLDQIARVDEIARMLAGDKVTAEAKEAARVLLNA